MQAKSGMAGATEENSLQPKRPESAPGDSAAVPVERRVVQALLFLERDGSPVEPASERVRYTFDVGVPALLLRAWLSIDRPTFDRAAWTLRRKGFVRTWQPKEWPLPLLLKLEPGDGRLIYLRRFASVDGSEDVAPTLEFLANPAPNALGRDWCRGAIKLMQGTWVQHGRTRVDVCLDHERDGNGVFYQISPAGIDALSVKGPLVDTKCREEHFSGAAAVAGEQSVALAGERWDRVSPATPAGNASRKRKLAKYDGTVLKSAAKKELVLNFIHERRFNGTLEELASALIRAKGLKISDSQLCRYGAAAVMRRYRPSPIRTIRRKGETEPVAPPEEDDDFEE